MDVTTSVNQLIELLVSVFGFNKETLMSGLLAAVLISNFIGRVIPDDKKGVLGVVRKVAKTIGLYVPNQIASGGLTADAIAKTVATQAAAAVVTSEPVVQEIEQTAQAVVPAFPGLANMAGDLAESAVEKLTK